MITSNFAIFILTHNRSSNVKTVPTLRNCGYTGKIYLILDDTDNSKDQYRENYPDCTIYVFDKKYAINKTDSADNTNNPKAVVYARNMVFEIASEIGLDYFLVLDDDYSSFAYTTDYGNMSFHRKSIKSFDCIVNSFVEFLETTNIDTICFAQGGDFIGGQESDLGSNIKLSRKAMNSFFNKTSRPYSFYGLINEDVNMYVLNGSRGKLCFTASHIQLNQVQTQKNSGGLTTIYLEAGTYVKSFYSVMYHPSSVTIKEMGMSNMRIHHRVNAELTYPKIISEKHKKLNKSEMETA